MLRRLQNICIVFVMILLSMMSPQTAYAQVQVPQQAAEPTVPQSAQELEAALRAERSRSADLMKMIEMLDANYQDALQAQTAIGLPVIRAYANAWVARYKMAEDNMRQASSIYAWQLRASDAILTLVLIVTIAGVLFAGWQLGVSSWILITSKDKQFAPGDNELVIEPGKISVTSASVGVVVLVLSLAFLYLFLDRVYQIDPNVAPDIEAVPDGNAEPPKGAEAPKPAADKPTVEKKG